METPEIEKDDVREGGPAILFPATAKQAYQQVFCLPASRHWDIEGSVTDIYYQASKAIIQGVSSRQYLEGVEGIAGLFLFRHYLELRLKYALFHARWLKTWSENERTENVRAIDNVHDLNKLWLDLKDACKTRVLPEQWMIWDIEFVDKCVDEWHGVDPKSFNFRYGTRGKISVAPTSEAYPERIGIDFDALLYDITHIHDVLEAIDSYLFESYGENKEWEAILNSF
jgi:hypothetical protein